MLVVPVLHKAARPGVQLAAVKNFLVDPDPKLTADLSLEQHHDSAAVLEDGLGAGGF